MTGKVKVQIVQYKQGQTKPPFEHEVLHELEMDSSEFEGHPKGMMYHVPFTQLCRKYGEQFKFCSFESDGTALVFVDRPWYYDWTDEI